MQNKTFYLLLLALSMLFLSGCLTVEKKEYTFQINAKGSGTLTIKYINIMSMQNDSSDLPANDFSELIDYYINGNEIELKFPKAQVRSKRLFEEDGQLCGEVIINFRKMEDIGFFRYKNQGPLMFHVGGLDDSEIFLNTNGEFGGDQMPVVFWNDTEETLKLSTYLTEPGQTTTSLLEEYQKWK